MPDPYVGFFAQYENSKNQMISPCERLRRLDTTVVDVKKDRPNYWQWRLEGWPCLMTNHREIIDYNLKRLELERPDLVQRCIDYRALETQFATAQTLFVQNQALMQQCTTRMDHLKSSTP